MKRLKDLGAGSFDEMIDLVSQKEMTNWHEDVVMKKAANDSQAFRSSKDIYLEEIERVGGCNRYDPCKMCYKCKNKASHLYVKCQLCRVPICVHKYSDVAKMIKRDNFKIELPEDVAKDMLNIK